MTLPPPLVGIDGPTALAAQAPHLRGCVPAPLGRRAAARGLDFLLGVLVGSIASLPLRSASSLSQVMSLGLVAQVVVIVFTVVVYVYFARTGYLPGGRLLGIRQVRLIDGASPGWAGFLKYLLIAVVGGVTLGIGYLVTVLLIRKPLNQAWHDRVTGLIVLDVRAGRDPATPAPPIDVSAAPSVPAISLVGLDAVKVPPTESDVPALWTSQAPDLGSSPVVGKPVLPPVSTPAAVSVVGGELGVITSVPGRRARTVEPSGAPEATVAPVVTSHVTPSAATPAPTEAPPATSGPVDGVEEVEDHTLLAPSPLSLGASGSMRALFADDGERINIDRVVIVGRNPTAPPGFPDARLVVLRDPSMSTSKTHAVLRPDPGGVWVMDLHSTNGSAVTTPSGIRTAVPAGGALVVASGGQLHLGRRSFHVIEA